MKITTKGQVTIPQEIREAMGMLPHTEVRFEIRGDEVVLSKLADRDRGARIVEHLRGRATSGMSTDEIMALMRGDPAERGA
jgi:AbrB family looped-hinge helix DNA binding protein